MFDEMGAFRVDVEIENPMRPGERRLGRSVLVDTGAELSRFPSAILESLGIRPLKMWHFRQADGDTHPLYGRRFAVPGGDPNPRRSRVW